MAVFPAFRGTVIAARERAKVKLPLARGAVLSVRYLVNQAQRRELSQNRVCNVRENRPQLKPDTVRMV
jgi:hypothetical protein